MDIFISGLSRCRTWWYIYEVLEVHILVYSHTNSGEWKQRFREHETDKSLERERERETDIVKVKLFWWQTSNFHWIAIISLTAWEIETLLFFFTILHDFYEILFIISTSLSIEALHLAGYVFSFHSVAWIKHSDQTQLGIYVLIRILH